MVLRSLEAAIVARTEPRGRAKNRFWPGGGVSEFMVLHILTRWIGGETPTQIAKSGRRSFEETRMLLLQGGVPSKNFAFMKIIDHKEWREEIDGTVLDHFDGYLRARHPDYMRSRKRIERSDFIADSGVDFKETAKISRQLASTVISNFCWFFVEKRGYADTIRAIFEMENCTPFSEFIKAGPQTRYNFEDPGLAEKYAGMEDRNNDWLSAFLFNVQSHYRLLSDNFDYDEYQRHRAVVPDMGNPEIVKQLKAAYKDSGGIPIEHILPHYIQYSLRIFSGYLADLTFADVRKPEYAARYQAAFPNLLHYVWDFIRRNRPIKSDFRLELNRCREVKDIYDYILELRGEYPPSFWRMIDSEIAPPK